MKQVLTYTTTAIALHWLIALLVFVTFPVGVIMSEMALSPDKLRMLSYHKWLGVTVFILLVVRLVWRVAHKPAPLDVAMPQWQRMAASGVHVLLYVLLFAIPLSGWLMSSAKGFQTVYLGAASSRSSSFRWRARSLQPGEQTNDGGWSRFPPTASSVAPGGVAPGDPCRSSTPPVGPARCTDMAPKYRIPTRFPCTPN